jgi:mono/diheme cytochrome c family protein
VLRLLSSLALVVVLATAAVAQDLAASFKAQVKPLVDAHCVACHGPDEQKATLRLDTLTLDLDDPKTLAQWVRVYDKLAAGEMPPPDSDRPPAAMVASATSWLKRELHTASHRQQQKKGRVVLRRLNGTEYENTLRDLLLLPDLRVKEMLPDDNSAAGFDNVSAVLDVSSTHQLLYQEAAEKAVLAAVPQHPPLPFKDKRTGKQMSEKGPNFRQTLSRSCRLEGDSLVIHTKLPRYGLCSSANVPTAGRYRVRMSIGAVGEGVKFVPAAFLTVEQSGREDPVVREFRDIPVGKPQLIELEFNLKRRQAFVVNMLSIWDIRAFKRPIEEYTGPGLVVDWIEVEGPLDPYPSPAYERLFGGVPLKARSVVVAEAAGKKPPTIPENRTESNWIFDPLVPTSAQPKEDAERLIRDFLPRAFRRPVSEELTKHFIDRVHRQLDDGEMFLDAMVYGYKSILSSPHFLLFTEPGSAEIDANGDLVSPRLDDFALANRLSYFLWSTRPDEALLRLAAAGKLTDGLGEQVDRMLAHPRARRFTENFTGQWLDMRKIAATIPDPQLYGDFDGVLLWAMPRETYAYFEEVLRNDRSLLEFVDSDWTMLNERLATHYGIPGVVGNDLRKVTLPAGSHRGGVITHASVMKVTADGTQTSPVLRGKWVLERIIGKPPAPPPPDVPAIEPDIRGATTIRQQLDKHRNIATCASCHVHIDPPGFALESFDPIGGFREFYRASARTSRGAVQLANYTGRPIYRGLDVELGGTTHDGKSFKNIEEYKQILLSDPDQLARNLTQKLMIYATGADIQFADREVVEEIVGTIRKKNYGFRTLVHEIVQSEVFLNK